MQNERDQLFTNLKKIENFINSIKNTPESFDKEIQTLAVNLLKYEEILMEPKNNQLIGAIAVNAALTWFGGGVIGAIGTGLWARGKNASDVKEIQQQVIEINNEIASIMALVAEVKERTRLVTRTYLNLSERLIHIEYVPKDYAKWNDVEIKQVGTLVNNALSAEKILNAKLENDGKFH